MHLKSAAQRIFDICLELHMLEVLDLVGGACAAVRHELHPSRQTVTHFPDGPVNINAVESEGGRGHFKYRHSRALNAAYLHLRAGGGARGRYAIFTRR